jgi:hypothetical protein
MLNLFIFIHPWPINIPANDLSIPFHFQCSINLVTHVHNTHANRDKKLSRVKAVEIFWKTTFLVNKSMVLNFGATTKRFFDMVHNRRKQQENLKRNEDMILEISSQFPVNFPLKLHVSKKTFTRRSKNPNCKKCGVAPKLYGQEFIRK